MPSEVTVVAGDCGSGKIRVPKLDDYTHAVIGLEFDHHEVHEGDSYSCNDTVNVNAATQYWMVTTPDTAKYANMVFNAVCTGEMLIAVTEGADRTGVASLTAINRNRNSLNASGLVVHRGYSGGTTNGAVTIETERTGLTGVGGKTLEAGQTRGLSEFVLKRNTKYVIAVTTYDNVHVTLKLSWYEHTSET